MNETGKDSAQEPVAEKTTESCAEQTTAPEKSTFKVKAGVIVGACVIIAVLVFIFAIRPVAAYKQAEKLMTAGEYDAAEAAFADLDDYKDAADRAEEAGYKAAEKALAEGDYMAAAEQFASLEDYSDAASRVSECYYAMAESLMKGEAFEEAAAVFAELGGYEDAKERVEEAKRAAAENYIAAQDFESAMAIYEELDDEDGQITVELSRVEAYMDAEDCEAALALLQTIEDDRAEDLKVQLRRKAPALMLQDAQYWDTVIFGEYEQDGDTSNGAEPIEWKVLKREGNTLMLISTYCLTTRPLNTTYATTTWSTSSLRAWLNDEFLRTAFNDAEREIIPLSHITTPGNLKYNSWGGEATDDYVFILGMKEVEQLFPSVADAAAKATPAAQAEGAYSGRDGNTWWWTRNMGEDYLHGTGVATTGYVNAKNADVVNSRDGTVRPVIYVEID